MTTLHIKHSITFDKKGNIRFVPNSRKQDFVEVVAFYQADGRVRTKSGDVYAAKLLPTGNFETVAAV